MSATLLADSTIAVSGTLILIAIAGFWLASNRRPLSSFTRRITRFLPNASDPRLVAATVQWWRRRLIGVACGLIVGSVASTFYVWWIGADRGSPAIDLLVLGGVAGGALGAGAARLPSMTTEGPAGTRVAQSRHLRLKDFTPRWLRTVTRSCVLIAVATFIGSVFIYATSTRYNVFEIAPSASTILTALAVLAWARFEIGGRSIVRHSTSAGSEADLTANSILRCLAIGDLARAAALIGAVAALLGVPGLLIALDSSIPTPAFVAAFNLTTAALFLIGTAEVVLAPPRIQSPANVAVLSQAEVEIPQ